MGSQTSTSTLQTVIIILIGIPNGAELLDKLFKQ